jgi:HSP20 family protein
MPETGAQLKRFDDTAGIKPVKPESLMEEINGIFERISRRAFEIFQGSGQPFGHDVEDWFKAEGEILHPVHLNISETDESVSVKAEVPGFTEKDLAISIEPRRVTITGKRESKKEEKKGKAVYTEACSDQILRILELPADVDADKAQTTLKNGILELTIPKVAKTRTIPVQAKSAAA